MPPSPYDHESVPAPEINAIKNMATFDPTLFGNGLGQTITMDEIKLVKALLQCKSFKIRQQHLEESLNILSFDYPDLYSQLFKEMKRRELAFNDPTKITKWLCSSNPDVYLKLHEALILVKSHNIMAKEEYINNLEQMLFQTIKNRTNIELAVKICNLIEKSPHLNTIKERLIHLIRQVKQLNNTCSTYVKNHKKKLGTGNFQQTPIIKNFKQLNIQCPPYVQLQQDTPVWPTMPQPTDLITTQDLPCFSLNPFGYYYLEMSATVNRFPILDYSQTFSNQTIVSQEMDGVIYNWLHYLKLHKYQWFFNALSYHEIEYIDEDNIEEFILKVNINSITKGAQRKICMSTKALRDRPLKLKNISTVLDSEVTQNEFYEIIIQTKEMLHYPIPNKCCVNGDQLQQDFVLVMGKFFYHLQKKLNASYSLTALNLLRSSVNRFLECTLLITKNQTFNKEQFEQILIFSETLKYNVKKKTNSLINTVL